MSADESGGGGGGRLAAVGMSETESQLFWWVIAVPASLLVFSVALLILQDLGAGGAVTSIGGVFGGAFAWIAGWWEWITQTAPEGSTPVPLFDFSIPNTVLMAVGMIAMVFVVFDRLTADRFGGGLPIVADFADLSRAGVVVFFVWLVYIRADSILDLVWWAAVAIPFALIGIVVFAYLRERRVRARASTAARNTPEQASDIARAWGNMTTNGLVAGVTATLALLEVLTNSVSAIGADLIGISSELVYTAVVWIGYTSLGGDLGSGLLPEFSAEQYVFIALILGIIAVTVRGISTSDIRR